MEKPSSIKSDVSSNTQSASPTKRFKGAYSQATLHSFINKKTREEIVAKLVAVDGFSPSAVCKREFICHAFSDKGMLNKKSESYYAVSMVNIVVPGGDWLELWFRSPYVASSNPTEDGQGYELFGEIALMNQRFSSFYVNNMRLQKMLLWWK